MFSVTLRDDNVQEFDTRWDEVFLSMSKIPSGEILEILYKLRIRESDQLKTVSELYDMEIHRKISFPNYQKLNTMVKRSKDQKLRLRNVDARHGKIETGAVVNNRKGLSGVEGGKGICYQWKQKSQCSKGDQCSFRHVRRETNVVACFHASDFLGSGLALVLAWGSCTSCTSCFWPLLPSAPSHKRARSSFSATAAAPRFTDADSTGASTGISTSCCCRGAGTPSFSIATGAPFASISGSTCRLRL